MSTDKKTRKPIEERLLKEYGTSAPPENRNSDKGHWKFQDGDWVWIPVDKNGIPLQGDGPVLPGDK